MNASSQQIQLGLEDLLGDLLYARRSGDLGRLALLSYFEVRRWARMAGHQGLAEHASARRPGAKVTFMAARSPDNPLNRQGGLPCRTVSHVPTFRSN
jgi:hypothetical protein